MNESYIKMYRGLIDWEWFNDSKVVHLFIYLLLKANFVDGNFKGHEVKRGQLITGRKKLSVATGISESAIRTCLDKLQNTNEIAIKTTNDFSIVTIVKYDVYQSYDKKVANKTPTKQPTSSQQIATIEEGNKEKNNKVSFKDSLIFDKNEFKKAFPEWTKEKLSYYYDSALTWSNEGNKKIDWIATVRTWATRDEKQGKIKFNNITKNVDSGIL